MDWHARIRSALARTVDSPDPDVVEELAQHAGAMYAAARAAGRSPEEADRLVCQQIDVWQREAAALRRRVVSAPAVEPPAAVRVSTLAGVSQDIRYAVRMVLRQPRFASLVVCTVAAGIAATTTVFSVTYGVLVSPLPWPDSHRLVVLKETRGGRSPRFGAFTNAAYLAWREQASTIEEMAAWSSRSVILAGAGDPERIRVVAGSASLFGVLRARPLIGTLFTAKDEATRVVVLSEGIWRQRFGAGADVLGRSVALDGERFAIIGVLPDALAYPDSQTRAWIPLRVGSTMGNSLSMFNALARLQESATPEHAAAEGTERGRHAAATGPTTVAIFGGDGPIAVSAIPLHDAITGEIRRPLLVLLAAVLLLFVVAIANVGGLQLAQATTRRRELAIRAALGATSARVVRQLLIESVCLSAAGGAAGAALAWVLSAMLPSILPADFPRADAAGLSGAVLMFAATMSGAAGVLFGLLPARRARHINLVASLCEGGTSPVGVSARTGIARTRLAMIAFQVAIACVMLVGASLLGRSFVKLLTADRGLDPRVIAARLSMPAANYTPARRSEVLTRILERVAALPGVNAAALASELPLVAGGSTASVRLPRHGPNGGPITVQASPRLVSPGYFAVLGLRMLAGRPLQDSDTLASQPVVVVNETFARSYLRHQALGVEVPVGFWYQDQPQLATVVGVVEDVRYVGASTVSQPEMYFSYRQVGTGVPTADASLLVQTESAPRVFVPLLRTAVREADDRLVAESAMTFRDRLLLTSLARPRLYAVLFGSFAAAAVLVVAVGLFGVLSYTVAQRSRELGIRLALGAQRRDLILMVVRQGIGVAVAGVIVGLTIAAVLGRFVGTLLYGVSPGDPLTYVVVPAVLLVLSAAASYIPARRAASVDPLRTLRAG